MRLSWTPVDRVVPVCKLLIGCSVLYSTEQSPIMSAGLGGTEIH